MRALLDTHVWVWSQEQPERLGPRELPSTLGSPPIRNQATSPRARRSPSSRRETLDEVAANLREAVALHLDGEDMAALGFVPEPTTIVTLEFAPAHD